MTLPYAYTLSGSDVHISYIPVGPGASPHLTYTDHTRGQRTFEGAGQIERVQTLAGTIVSVLLDTVPDKASTTFSFLQPQVNLDSSNTALIHTVGITAVHQTSLVGPPPTGQVEKLSVVALHGQADNIGIHPL